MPQRPRILSAEELARVHADDAQKQEAIAARKESLKQEFGEKFEQQASLEHDDDNVRKLAADKMAEIYAERNTRPDLVDGRMASDIRSDASSFARKLDDYQLMNDLGPYAREPSAVDASPEQKTESAQIADDADKAPVEVIESATRNLDDENSVGRLEEDAASVAISDEDWKQEWAERGIKSFADMSPKEKFSEFRREVLDEILERHDGEYEDFHDSDGNSNETAAEMETRHAGEVAEFEEAFGPIQWSSHEPPDPERHPEAGTEHKQEMEPEPEPSYSPHLFEQHEEIRHDAQGKDYVEPPAEGASEQRRTPDAEPVVEPALEAERAAPNTEIEPPEVTTQADAHEPPQQPESEPKRLRFYEDLKQEHANAIGNGHDKADPDEKGDAGQKKLTFFEDKGPSQDHGPEH